MSRRDTEQANGIVYKVLVNHEEQLSLWPVHRENPLGWRDVGVTGSREECLAYVREVWTDMRPQSLRKRMEEPAAPSSPSSPSSIASRERQAAGAASDLIGRLCAGEQRIEADLRTEKTADALKAALDCGYFPITFTDTLGCTRLRVRLDLEASNMNGADFERGTGTLSLAGGLMLDSIPVRCFATIDLRTLAGSGRLERAEA
jgi:MbtH protein